MTEVTFLLRAAQNEAIQVQYFPHTGQTYDKSAIPQAQGGPRNGVQNETIRGQSPPQGEGVFS